MLNVELHASYPTRASNQRIEHPRRGLREKPIEFRPYFGDCHRPADRDHCSFAPEYGTTTGPKSCILGRGIVSRTKMSDRYRQHVGLPRVRFLRDSLDMVQGVLDLLGYREERRGFLFVGHGLS